MEVTEYVKLPDNAKTAMSMVAAADYDLSLKKGMNRLQTLELLQMASVSILRKKKNSDHKTDEKKRKSHGFKAACICI